MVDRRILLFEGPDSSGGMAVKHVRVSANRTFRIFTAPANSPAGMDGIKNRIEPPASLDRNIFRLTKEESEALGVGMLPGDLMSANTALMEDDILCNALGWHVIDNLNRLAEIEWNSFRMAVHPWEVEQYLERY